MNENCEDMVESIEAWYIAIGNDLSSNSSELFEYGVRLYSTISDFKNPQTASLLKVIRISSEIYAQTSNSELKIAMLSAIEICLKNDECKKFFIEQQIFKSLFSNTSQKVADHIASKLIVIFMNTYIFSDSILEHIDIFSLFKFTIQILDFEPDVAKSFINNCFQPILQTIIPNIKLPPHFNNIFFTFYKTLISQKNLTKNTLKQLPLLISYPEDSYGPDEEGNLSIPFEISSSYLDFCLKEENDDVSPLLVLKFFNFSLNEPSFREAFYHRIPDIFKFAKEREWDNDQCLSLLIEIQHKQPRKLPKISPKYINIETQTDKEFPLIDQNSEEKERKIKQKKKKIKN